MSTLAVGYSRIIRQITLCHARMCEFCALSTRSRHKQREHLMNTSSTTKPNLLPRTLAAVLVRAVRVLIMASFLTSTGTAQQERVFENTIPAHIPIKIKIKKEKEQSFKDLKNEKWLREFELEVTNTGDRPIYYLEIVMDTDVKFQGSGPEIVFPLRYGRPELGDIVTKATNDDVPIKPGETIVLTTRQADLWEKGIREKLYTDATKFKAVIQVLSFGDGTGYWPTELYTPADRRKPAAKTRGSTSGDQIGLWTPIRYPLEALIE